MRPTQAMRGCTTLTGVCWMGAPPGQLAHYWHPRCRVPLSDPPYPAPPLPSLVQRVDQEADGVDQDVDGNGAAAVVGAPPPQVVLGAQLRVGWVGGRGRGGLTLPRWGSDTSMLWI